MEKYRKTTTDKLVKFDDNPENDYSDGYNAGRRYVPKKSTKWWLILIPILLLLLGLLLWFLFNLFNTNLSDKAQPAGTTQTAPAVTTHASPAPSVVPSTLPATGTME